MPAGTFQEQHLSDDGFFDTMQQALTPGYNDGDECARKIPRCWAHSKSGAECIGIGRIFCLQGQNQEVEVRKIEINDDDFPFRQLLLQLPLSRSLLRGRP